MKAIVFGEIIWDVYPDQSVIGGAAFNFGAHMAHLGDEVYLLSAVGTDELGIAATQELKRFTASL
jgi:fructokinase